MPSTNRNIRVTAHEEMFIGAYIDLLALSRRTDLSHAEYDEALRKLFTAGKLLGVGSGATSFLTEMRERLEQLGYAIMANYAAQQAVMNVERMAACGSLDMLTLLDAHERVGATHLWGISEERGLELAIRLLRSREESGL